MKIPRIARSIVKKARHSWALHGAIVQKGGNILSASSNKETKHAEEAALNLLWPSERRNTKVWSIRITKGGQMAMAKPCNNCVNYMIQNGVRTVYFSNQEGKIEMMRI